MVMNPKNLLYRLIRLCLTTVFLKPPPDSIIDPTVNDVGNR